MRKWLVVGCFLLMLLSIAGCDEAMLSADVAAPERWRVDSSVVRMTPEELFESSDAVIVGVVTGRPVSKKVPGPKTDRLPDGEPMIVSDWSVNVKEVLKGDVSNRIVVRLEGGITPDLEIDIADEARLAPGETVFLYLNKDQDAYRVNGLFQGKYSVLRDGRASNRDPGLDSTLDRLRGRRSR